MSCYSSRCRQLLKLKNKEKNIIMHHLHIFLASPDDVGHERQLAQAVINRVQSERIYRDNLKIEVVAWDKPGAGTAMPAHLEPVEAINRGLKKPSECDIVVVIFWQKMGTPLSNNYHKPDGSRYRSGTEYEFIDALKAAKKTDKPNVLVYRRQGSPKVDLEDPKREDKEKQWDFVKTFFAELRNSDGSYQSFYQEYDKPFKFKDLFDQHLRDLIPQYLEIQPSDKSEQPREPELPIWVNSPFPGLRAFTPEEALIFYGRGRETDLLIERLNDSQSRFIAVVGTSGSGKSSLVAAGLLPALEKNAIQGSQDWACLRFTPAELSDNPFSELVNAFKPILQKQGRPLRKAANDLETNPLIFQELAAMALQDTPEWAELLLFIDQFEELFTLADAKYQRAFVDLLALAAKTPRVRTIVTMRADFYHRCLEWTVMDELLASGHFPLLAPRMGALNEMVTQPAERAGLQLEKGLVQRILDDTGTEPGALALMAFALWELWKSLKGADGLLTHAAYDSFKGVHGAIGKRAEEIFNSIKGKKTVLEAAFGRVFRELVEVDEKGVATRRRTPLSQTTTEAVAETLVNALTEARLLVTSRGEDHEPMVEVAHEAIFTNWPRVKDWIDTAGDDLRLRRQVRQATAAWEADEPVNKYKHIWSDDRVVDVVGMLERLGLEMEQLGESERGFLGPIDIETMLAELDDPSIAHEQRATIGVRLSLLGDPRPGVGLRPDGLPDIAWCEVPGGEVTLEIERRGKLSRFFGGSGSKPFRVEPFYIAKHPITWIQYRSFLEAEDGFKGPAWWQGLMFQVEEDHRQFNQRDNHPAENLSWLEAVAFCRWLSSKLGYEVRLPCEWEWQMAATGGNPENEYPWGAAWDSSYTNTYKSGLNRSTAVGMYPQGASPVGALDMGGNVWEWCLNEFDKYRRVDVSGNAGRAVRGGSWGASQGGARCGSRGDDDPGSRLISVGFRVCCVSPIF